jgi:hypothetical protein
LERDRTHPLSRSRRSQHENPRADEADADGAEQIHPFTREQAAAERDHRRRRTARDRIGLAEIATAIHPHQQRIVDEMNQTRGKHVSRARR